MRALQRVVEVASRSGTRSVLARCRAQASTQYHRLLTDVVPPPAAYNPAHQQPENAREPQHKRAKNKGASPTGLHVAPHTITSRIPHPFSLSLGGSLSVLDVNWSLVGNPSGPCIFIMPSMSHSANVTRPRHERGSSSSSSQPGWWEAVVGWGDSYGIDLNVFCLLSASALGAPFGSTSPLSIDVETGKPYRAQFPLITPLDQANCHYALLTHLQSNPSLLPAPYIEHNPLKVPPFAVIGSSMGGMATIQFAVHHPNACRRVVIICTTARSSPSTQALRSVQRHAVRMDAQFHHGNYDDAGVKPETGMKLARKIGTICYRSRTEFDLRFDHRSRLQPGEPHHAHFPVNDYLNHTASSFVTRYDANCYLTLSQCMDLQDIAYPPSLPDYYAACQNVRKDSEWMILPVTQDALIPPAEMDYLASQLGGLGISVHHERIDSVYGHDAFLKDGHVLNPRIAEFLTRGNAQISGVQSVRRFVNELYQQ